MHFLNEVEKDQLRVAIRAAETRTHGEIVAVVARASGDYFYYPTLWAALAAMVSPTLLLGLPFDVAALGIVEMQLALFVVLVLLLRLPSLKMLFVPRAVQRLHAARRAREQFFVHNLHTTHERSGVLLFVSVAEGYVELLADAGIHAKVPAGTWDTIVAEFTARVRAGEIAEGFTTAVNAIGAQLQVHFPAEAGDPNELPDHLIELR
jgi:putative membrane protein